MPAKKYRTIQTPPAVSNVTAREAVELARAAAAIMAARRVLSGKSNGQVTDKTTAGSRLTHSPRTSSRAVGKSAKAKSTPKSVASKR